LCFTLLNVFASIVAGEDIQRDRFAEGAIAKSLWMQIPRP